MFESTCYVTRARDARTVELAPAVSVQELLSAALPSSSRCYECKPPKWLVPESRFRAAFRTSVLRDASRVKETLLKRTNEIMGGDLDMAQLRSLTAGELWSEVTSAGEEAAQSVVQCLYLANQLSSRGSYGQRLGRLGKQVGWTLEKLISVLTPVTGHCVCRSCGQERANYSTLFLAPEQKASRFTLQCPDCGHFENRFSYVRCADWQQPFLRCHCQTCRGAQDSVREYAMVQQRKLLPRMATAAQQAFAQVAAGFRLDDLPRTQDGRGQKFLDRFYCELRQSGSVSQAVLQVGTRYLDCNGRPDPHGVVRALVADRVLNLPHLPRSYDVGVVDVEEAWDRALTDRGDAVTLERFQKLLGSDHASIAFRAVRQDIPKLSLEGAALVSRYAPAFALNESVEAMLA